VSQDPLDRVKLVVAYVVAGVWAIVFIVALARPPEDSTQLLATQAAMMAIIGALFVDRYIKRGD